MWAVPMSAEMWIALIPVVIVERVLFASGISVAYIGLNTLLQKIVEKVPEFAPSKFLHIDGRYVLSGKMLIDSFKP